MSKLFRAAMLVTIFSVITRALGFLMKIILSRSLTPSLLGEYQLAMSIFSVMLTLISSGLPLITSRKVAYYSNEDTQKAYKSTSAGLIISLIISILFSILLFIFEDVLCEMFASETIGAMVVSLAPALIFSSVYSILRGALWGQKRFFMISFTELFEQLIRIIFLIILFAIPISNFDAGTKATFSLSIACIFSGILVFILYFKSGNKIVNPKGQILPVIKESSSITLARTASSIVQMLIAFIIPLRLTTFGYTEEQAMAEFGIVTGMALPLITIPGTFISSIAVALVPEISAQTTNIDNDDQIKNRDLLKKQISIALSAALIISFMCVPAFLALGHPIAQIVFNNFRAGTYITAGSCLMITMGLTQITSSILNAIGLEIKALKNYCIGAASLIACIYFLPKYIGAMSLVVAMLSLSIISGLLGLAMLKKRKLLSANLSVTTFKLVIITIVSSLITYFTYAIVSKFITMFFATAIAGIISLVSFFALCYAMNIVTIKSFFSSKIFKKSKKKN